MTTQPMKILVWQWGRRGSGPRYAAGLAASLRASPGATALLSLSAQAEILQGGSPPTCELPLPTYGGLAGFLWRVMQAPFQIAPLARRIRKLGPTIAICAQPAPLDLLMARALRRAGIPFFAVVHDADLHPGDGFPFQMALQRRLMHEANGLIALTAHVANRLHEQDAVRGRTLIMTFHPPLPFAPATQPPMSHGGRLRLLFFGRLLTYKGLDLLAEALAKIDPATMDVRVVGLGPESADLAALRRLPNVTVENRWVPEAEVPILLNWADALVMSYREASQSGVAAVAIAAGRWVVATRVGGIAEQVEHEPLARLCAPNATSLATTLTSLITNPPPTTVTDPALAWRTVAAELVRGLKEGWGASPYPARGQAPGP